MMLQTQLTPLKASAIAHWIPFECLVAFRFLREGRVQTMFIIGGVAIGVGVIVFMSALLSGLQANFVKRVLTGQAHIQLLPPKEVSRVLPISVDTFPINSLKRDNIVQAPLQRAKSIDQWQSLAHQIKNMPQVAVVSPSVSGSALIVRGAASRAISVLGVDPDLYFKIVPMPEKIIHGTARITVNDILIGTELAADLGLSVGDKLLVTAANGNANTFLVSGIFDLGNKAANSRTTMMPLRAAQSLLGLVGGVTSLDVTVHDVYAAEAVAQNITAQTGIQADSWIKTNEQFFTAVNAQTTANTAIRMFVGLSVAFGIASVLVVSVVQKSREIGILRAMGITRGQILQIFLLQGGLLGFGGALVGCTLGWAGLLIWQQTERNPDGTVMFAMAIEPSLFMTALVLASITGLIASFAPALRAARLDPVVAIRG
jgi:lipoprotein-releasing system permease protein